MRRRVGPATTVSGAAITCVAARWAAASDWTVTFGGSLTTGSATGARPKPARAATITARAAARSSRRPVEPGAIVTCRPRRTSRASRCGALIAAAEQVELVAEAGLVGLRLRREVLREELEPEPLVAAHEAEAVTRSRRVRDGRVPVDHDAEPARRQTEGLAAGGERDRYGRELRGTLLEQALARRPVSTRRGRGRRPGCPWRACRTSRRRGSRARPRSAHTRIARTASRDQRRERAEARRRARRAVEDAATARGMVAGGLAVAL